MMLFRRDDAMWPLGLFMIQALTGTRPDLPYDGSWSTSNITESSKQQVFSWVPYSQSRADILLICHLWQR